MFFAVIQKSLFMSAPWLSTYFANGVYTRINIKQHFVRGIIERLV